MMFDEVLIQIGGAITPHDVQRSDDSNREELVMLMMREATSKNQ